MHNFKLLVVAISVVLISLPALGQKKEAENYLFTNKIVNEHTEIKNQQHTGTCWSFSSTSFLESELIRLGKGAIDLSEMYNVRMNYQDKSFNYVMRQGKAQFGEGGLNHDVMNSIKFYGVVPESEYEGNLYKPGKHDHSEMVAVLSSQLKTVVSNPSGKLSPVWMGSINGTLDSYMGVVPESFEYEGKSYTPKTFAQMLEINPANYPTFTSFSHVPFYENYIVQIPDNWSNGSYMNIPMDDMMLLIDEALKNGFTIAWDADVSERTWSRKKSMAILPAVPYSEMNKEQRQDLFKKIIPEMTPSQEARQEMYLSYETTDDHLMHIVGTAVDQDNNAYYLVKNSWGTKHNYDGYVYVSRAYMAMKTIGVMVHTDAVPKAIQNQIK